MTVWCIVEFLCRREMLLPRHRMNLRYVEPRLREKLAVESISLWFMPRLSFSGVTSATFIELLPFSFFLPHLSIFALGMTMKGSFNSARCLLSRFVYAGSSRITNHSFPLILGDVAIYDLSLIKRISYVLCNNRNPERIENVLIFVGNIFVNEKSYVFIF